MRKMLFLLLLSPLLCEAQDMYEAAFLKSIPAGLGEPIALPKNAISWSYDIKYAFDPYQKSRIYVISSDSAYRKIFQRYPIKDSIPDIDFSKKDIVLYSACYTCMAVCHHDREDNCHRGACDFYDAWFIRNKTEEPALRKLILDRSNNIYRDSLSGCSFLQALPKLHRSNFLKHFEVGHYSTYKYAVNTDSVYYEIFSGYAKSALPVIDFSKQELVVNIACAQCIAYCTDNRPCHRNACSYTFRWCVMDKKGIKN